MQKREVRGGSILVVVPVRLIELDVTDERKKEQVLWIEKYCK